MSMIFSLEYVLTFNYFRTNVNECTVEKTGSSVSFQQQVKEETEIAPTEENKEKLFSCYICNKSLSRAGNLKTHLESHTVLCVTNHSLKPLL